MKDGEIDVQSRNVKNAPTVVRIWYTNTSAIPWREEYAEASRCRAGPTLPYLLSEVRMPAIQRYPGMPIAKLTNSFTTISLGDLDGELRHARSRPQDNAGRRVPITHPIDSGKTVHVPACRNR